MAHPTDPLATETNTDPRPSPSDDPKLAASSQRLPEPEESAFGGWKTLLAVVVVLILAGLAGAAWYFQVWPFASDQKEAKAPSSQAAAGDQNPAGSDGTMRDVGQTDQDSVSPQDLAALSKRLDQLQRRIADQAPPDIKPLQERVNALEGLPDNVRDLSDQVDALAGRLGIAEQSIKSLRDDESIASLRGEESAERKQERSEARADAETDLQPKLKAAIDSFQDGHYREARALFDELRETHPEDARVWYYSALSTGLTTGEWKTTADRFAREGMDRERLSQPDHGKIDKALQGLTTRTGKDWIDAYRQRAEAKAASTP